MMGVAVKVTEVPAHKVLLGAFDAMLTLGVTFALTVIVRALLVAVLAV